MKISAWTPTRRDRWLHVSAQLQWEETERTETLWFEWPGEYDQPRARER